jgi:hypothetical protein
MLQLARELARWLHQVRLPEDVRLTVDVDPVNLL